MARKRKSGRGFRATVERIGWFLSGPFAALVLLLCIPHFDEAYDARENRGVPGAFVTEREDCSRRGGCTAYGTFVSDDGSIRLENVFIDDGGGDVGETVRAQYVETSYDKVYELNSHEWLVLWLLVIGAGLWLAGWIHMYVIRRVRFGTGHYR